MLKGISPLLSPELLALLSSMGHGEELVLADAHSPVPSGNLSPRLMRPRGSNNSACHRGASDEQPCQRRRCHSSDQPASL